MRYVVVTLGLAAALGHIIGLVLQHQVLIWLTKPIPVLLLILWACTATQGRYRTWILIGLVCSLIGDVFLMFGDAFFIHGLLAFLLGHLAYLRAYLQTGAAAQRLPLLGYVLWGGGAYALLFPHLGELAVPVLVYVSVICLMMWRATCCRGLGEWGRRAFWGALLFGISDTVLAFNRFYHAFAYAEVVVMSLYWLGQAAIAASVFRNASTRDALSEPRPS